MPPKRKAKKKKNVNIGRAGGMTLEEKYQHTLKRIETLQHHLTLRNEIAARSIEKSKVLHNQLTRVNLHVEEEKSNTYDISCDLKRQHKAMETELTSEITTTKSSLELLQEKLLQTEKELKREKEEKKKVIIEKDEKIATLEHKIDHLESSYEHILHDAFDMLLIQLDKGRVMWKRDSLNIQSENKELLLKFGLNPLDI